VGAALLRPEWYFLDHVGAILVSVFILRAAWNITGPALGRLVDTGAPPELVRELETLALSTAGVRLVHRVRTRHVGPGFAVDLHVKVDAGMTVREGHAISEEVRRRLLDEGPDVVDVVTHLEPYEGG
jgi:cation diffusion facilitator family transporter